MEKGMKTKLALLLVLLFGCQFALAAPTYYCHKKQNSCMYIEYAKNPAQSKLYFTKRGKSKQVIATYAKFSDTTRTCGRTLVKPATSTMPAQYRQKQANCPDCWVKVSGKKRFNSLISVKPNNKGHFVVHRRISACNSGASLIGVFKQKK